MSEIIPIKQTKEDLLHQWDGLRQIDNFNLKRDFGGVGIGIGVLSLIVVALYTLTPVDSLIVLKAISLFFFGLAWIGVFIFTLWHVIKRQRFNHAMEKDVVNQMALGKEHFLFFDEDKLVQSSTDYKTELSWTYFFAYLESPFSLFLFNKGVSYTHMAFTANEIGAENLERMKNIARRKLTPLNKNIHLKDRCLQKSKALPN